MKKVKTNKGLTKQEAVDFIEGCKRGIAARKRGDRVHWNDVKASLGIK